MKILFFMNGLHPGGKERRMLELMKGLKLKEDVEFELVLMSREISYPEIHEMEVGIHYLIRKSKKDFSIFRQFYKLCKEYRPDIIHCWDSMTTFYAIPACKMLNIKLMNGMVVDTPLRRNILNKNWLRARLTFPFSDIIIGNSKAGLEAYNAPLQKSMFIPNGYNFKRNNNLLEKELILEQLNIHTKFIVGMVATFSEFKDYNTYFKAAHIILEKRKDVTFLAIGYNTDSIKANELIRKSFRDYFRLLGEKSGIESYIQVMDIGVLSTFSEGISNSIMEYMALGKPVVATIGGGTNEIVLDKETGSLFNVSEPQDLADKIEFLLTNNEIGIQMGLKGQERVKQFFSIDSMIEKYIHVYENLQKHKGIAGFSFNTI